MYPGNGKCEFCSYPCRTCSSQTTCVTCGGNLANR
jgi:hypothetical protein